MMRFSFKSEPTLWLSFARALLYLFVLFGVSLTDQQVIGILLVVETFLALFNRSQVTPTANVPPKPPHGSIIGLVLLAVLATGCAANLKPIDRARVSVLTAAETVKGIDALEQTAFDGKLIPVDVHARNNALIVALVDGVLVYESAVSAWKDGPEPMAVVNARASLLAVLTQLETSFQHDGMRALAASLRIAVGVTS